MRKRWQAKLQQLKGELKRRMHLPVPEVGSYLRSVILGHIRYYGVPMNTEEGIRAFRWAVGCLWWRSLRRRSQNNRLSWERMERYINRWFPPAVSSGAIWRYDPRQEPVPHVRICGGGSWSTMIEAFFSAPAMAAGAIWMAWTSDIYGSRIP
jgi:hypothetical protein